jgi:hypothetical protein
VHLTKVNNFIVVLSRAAAYSIERPWMPKS